MKYKYAKVIFERNGEYNDNAKEYLYFNLGNSIKKGDLVVVPANNSYHVVKVTGFTNQEVGGIHTKHMVQRVDFEKFEAQKEKRELEDELKQAIEERIAKVKYMRELESFAEDDKDLKKLVKQLKELDD